MNIARRKKIVVLGMATRIPVAGVVWQTVHYLVGLERLGYETYYVEAHGATGTKLMRSESDDGPLCAAGFIADFMRRFGLEDRWAFHVPHENRCLGMSLSQLRQLYADADLIINLHGGTVPQPEHSATGRLIYVETDPVSIQIELSEGRPDTRSYLEPHVAFFTFGENYGRDGCLLPVDERFVFRPTRQPVVLDFWDTMDAPGGPCFTTIGNWKQHGRDVQFRGEVYHWSKHLEFLKFLDLPGRSGCEFELALSSTTEKDRRLLEQKGWRVTESLDFSLDLNAYRSYIQRSRGEFTVAKDQNVRLRTGWFSDRSATYLAAGRPVVTQDTGFGRVVPTGEGLFAFSTVEEAADAIKEINADYGRHSRAARAIAADYFRADVVLTRLLTDCGMAVKRPNSTSRGGRKRSSQGVNVCGYLRTESGVGAAARSYVKALGMLDVAVALKDLSELCDNRAEDQTLNGFVGEQPFDINLVCVDIDKHSSILSRFGEDFFKDHYNIGVCWWEAQEFPAKWWNRFGYYDEIWAGTSFIANNLAPISPLPVIRVPPVLTVDRLGSRERGRTRLAVGPDVFVFLFVFDFKSVAHRKNPEATIESFKRAFASSDPVRLVIKSVNGVLNEHGLSALRALAGDYPVSFYDGYWLLDEIRDLTAACDAYVSLHRSEGLGFTIADAMAHGKPVIATGWSGNMDFMTPSNSFPVEYTLVPIEDDAGLYAARGRWAEPSVSHAAELMRHLVDNRDVGRVHGDAARRAIEDGYSREAVAEIVRSRLNAIALRRRWPAFKRKATGAFAAYRRRVQQVVQEASSVLPRDATVLVVSRGDEELLNLPVRQAGHFPQLETGAYAGYYPADSADAISHLEDLRARGANYLVLPSTAFWWLDHYRAFAEHLGTYEVIQRDEACLIYSLIPSRGGTESLRVLQPANQHE